MRRNAAHAAGLGLALWSLICAAADPHQEHEAVQDQLAEEQEALTALQSQKAEVREALEWVAELGTRTDALVDHFGAELAALERQLSFAESREARARSELDARLIQLAPRLQALYRLTREGALALLLDAKDLSQLLRRRQAMAKLLEADLRLLREAQEALRLQQRALDELDTLKLAVARRRELMAEELEHQALRRTALGELFNVLEADAALASRAVGTLQRQERKLAALVDRLDSIPDTGFGANRGFLPAPVDGAFLEAGFGRMVNPRSNTVTVKKGIDLRAPQGSPVRAVAPGRVVFAAPYRSYGNLLIVDHGDGFHTLMAHLERFVRQVGDSVDEGEEVGRVGDTGSQKGAYLYFELRQNGFAVDPQQWFRDTVP